MGISSHKPEPKQDQALVAKAFSRKRFCTKKSMGVDSLTSNNTCHSSAATRPARGTQHPVDVYGGANQAVWLGRVLVILVLSAAMVVLGYQGNRLLTDTEAKLAERQFFSIAERALVAATSIAGQRRVAAATMASFISEVLPDSSSWPFVTVPGYERIDKLLMDATSSKEIGFAPLVLPEQAAQFEAFAYDYFARKFGNETPVGVSSFGKGIWARNLSLNNTDKRYHDTTGEALWGSPNTFMTPVFQIDTGYNNKVTMYNLHSEPLRGQAIDDIIVCLGLREPTVDNVDPLFADIGPELECGAITGIVDIVKYGNSPGAMILQPIHPPNNRSKLLGIVPTTLLFEEVLENAFADEVSGIQCVIENQNNESITYTVRNGVAHQSGKGDLHDRAYDRYRQSSVITNSSEYTEGSPMYTLSIYPTDRFIDVYSTTNPKIATIGSICIVVFTSLVFFLYDFFVRREFNAKKQLLRAKRQFMRFVSHEVRTPLNSVCMGLALLQTELAEVLGQKMPDTEPSNSSGDPVRKKASEWLAVTREIEASAQSAVEVLNDLLNYDKIENGALMLESQLEPVWEIVERIIDEFRVPATKKNIQFETVFNVTGDVSGDVEQEYCTALSVKRADELPDEAKKLMFLGDSVRVMQVLRNLLSNALKFTPEGGTVLVESSWEKTNEADLAPDQTLELDGGKQVAGKRCGYFRLIVEDSGVGMSADQLKKLFRDGIQFNVNKLQAGQGSGLGLYITKGIVEQHGGTLVASSEGLGKGARFTMTLPLWVVEDKQIATHTEEGTKNGEKVEKGPLRLLIIDDVLSNRKLLKRLLTKAGHICDEGDDGTVAVDLVRRSMEDGGTPYDCVLLDYEMVEMNGPPAAEEIRRMGSDVFIVGITGNVLPNDVAYFKSCGANAVLPKPLSLADLNRLWI